MEPAITIIEYLWGARNTWLKHHDDCDCPPEQLIEEFLENVITIDIWAEISTPLDGCPQLNFVKMRPREWSEMCGPSAQKTLIGQQIDLLMGEASKLMALQATYERLSNG